MFKHWMQLLWSIILLPACMQPSSKVRPLSPDTSPVTVSSTPSTFYNLQFNTLDGKSYDFAQLKGKKVIILNVASKCGFTPQYADWEKFHEANKDKVVVLGFPSNQFLGQEPGSNAEIGEFCQRNYGVTFQIFDKSDVKTGKEQNPVFKWLSDPTLNGWNKQDPSWNFCKYVIDEQGKLVAFFPSKVLPTDEEFKKAIGI